MGATPLLIITPQLALEQVTPLTALTIQLLEPLQLLMAIPMIPISSTHTVHPIIMVLPPLTTPLIHHQVLYLVQDLSQLPLDNAHLAIIGCLTVEAGVWPIATRMYLLAHLIFLPELQPPKQGHIIAVVSLMTRSPKNAKMGLAQAAFFGMAANV